MDAWYLIPLHLCGFQNRFARRLVPELLDDDLSSADSAPGDLVRRQYALNEVDPFVSSTLPLNHSIGSHIPITPDLLEKMLELCHQSLLLSKFYDTWVRSL